MGIFTEADHHPFHELDGFASAEEAHGGSGGEHRPDEQRVHDYVRGNETARTGGLYIRDELRS